MPRGEKNQNGPARTTSLTTVCLVCQGPSAAHTHYGAICCYSCRAFFRRGIHKNYACVRGDNSCQVNSITRTNCKRCRYQRCLAVGMKPALVDACLRKKTDQASDPNTLMQTVYQEEAEQAVRMIDQDGRIFDNNGRVIDHLLDQDQLSQLAAVSPTTSQQLLQNLQHQQPANEVVVPDIGRMVETGGIVEQPPPPLATQRRRQQTRQPRQQKQGRRRGGAGATEDMLEETVASNAEGDQLSGSSNNQQPARQQTYYIFHPVTQTFEPVTIAEFMEQPVAEEVVEADTNMQGIFGGDGGDGRENEMAAEEEISAEIRNSSCTDRSIEEKSPGLLHQVGHKVDGVEGLSSPSSAGGVQFDLSNEDHRIIHEYIRMQQESNSATPAKNSTTTDEEGSVEHLASTPNFSQYQGEHVDLQEGIILENGQLRSDETKFYMENGEIYIVEEPLHTRPLVDTTNTQCGRVERKVDIEALVDLEFEAEYRRKALQRQREEESKQKPSISSNGRTRRAGKRKQNPSSVANPSTTTTTTPSSSLPLPNIATTATPPPSATTTTSSSDSLNTPSYPTKFSKPSPAPAKPSVCSPILSLRRGGGGGNKDRTPNISLPRSSVPATKAAAFMLDSSMTTTGISSGSSGLSSKVVVSTIVSNPAQETNLSSIFPVNLAAANHSAMQGKVATASGGDATVTAANNRISSIPMQNKVSVIVSSAVSQPRKKKMAPTTGISKRIDRGNGGGSSDPLLHNGRPVPLPQSSIVNSVVSKDLKRKIHSRLASEPCAKLVPSSSSGTAAGDFCARINEEGLVFLEPPNKYKVPLLCWSSSEAAFLDQLVSAHRSFTREILIDLNHRHDQIRWHERRAGPAGRLAGLDEVHQCVCQTLAHHHHTKNLANFGIMESIEVAFKKLTVDSAREISVYELCTSYGADACPLPLGPSNSNILKSQNLYSLLSSSLACPETDLFARLTRLAQLSKVVADDVGLKAIAWLLLILNPLPSTQTRPGLGKHEAGFYENMTRFLYRYLVDRLGGRTAADAVNQQDWMSGAAESKANLLLGLLSHLRITGQLLKTE